MPSSALIPLSERVPLAVEQRRAVLQYGVNWYLARGFRVISQTDTTAQLVKPKAFSCLIASLSFLCLGIGALFYIFLFMAMKDQTAYLVVDEAGVLSVNGKAIQRGASPALIPFNWGELLENRALLIGLGAAAILACGAVTFFVVLAAADPASGSTYLTQRTPGGFSVATPTTAPVLPPTLVPNIPGLNPADITVNLEDRGHTCSAPEFGETYYYRTCEDHTLDLVWYDVAIWGRELFTVDYVSATVLQFTTSPSDELALPFLGYMATLPYDGAAPEAARVWVETTLPTIAADGDIRETVVGGITYSLVGAPSHRILNMGALP